jgi:hypothetical protein
MRPGKEKQKKKTMKPKMLYGNSDLLEIGRSKRGHNAIFAIDMRLQNLT